MRHLNWIGKDVPYIVPIQVYNLYSAEDSQNVSDYKNMQTFMPWVKREIEIVDSQHAQSTVLQYSGNRHKYQEKLLLILQT
jgi:hypothetical protein